VTRGWLSWLAAMVLIVLCLSHDYAVWVGSGGWKNLTSPWPLAIHDHPVHYHYTVITPTFLRRSGTTAGYDPSFMSGYAKSVVFPQSSTFLEVVAYLAGGTRPEVTYKFTVFGAVSALPWLVALGGLLAGLRPSAICVGVALYLTYLWTDFPINYATFGMTTYLLAIPVGLPVTMVVARYLENGGWRWWLFATAGSAVVLLVHLTAAMIVAPSAILVYVIVWLNARIRGIPLSKSRHAGVWGIAAATLALNAFWWVPGLWLSSTAGPSGFVFAHPEPVWERLAKIGWGEPRGEPRIEFVLVILGACGLIVLTRRKPLLSAGLVGFVGAGFFWGYLAGFSRSLDFLQPGRQTYAFYSGLALAAGFGIDALTRWLWTRNRLVAALAAAVGLACFVWCFYPEIERSLRDRLSARYGPFVSSRPSPQLQWIVNRLKRHLRPGDRLLYEEGGFDVPGLPDPYRGGRYSGLLPHLVPGIEVLGGPYLHVALTTNFTQFGEGKLFGKAGWGESDFRRHATLYRPSAILCWTPHARKFCRDHPELVEVWDDDRGLLIGRIKGFDGPTIRGKAEVQAEPGRLRVRVESGELDELAVLRYHFVPSLRSQPPIPLVPVYLEDDPVPFIGLRPFPGEVIIELGFPPRGT
jgi:hypothetical protein